MRNRDEFTQAVKETLANRASQKCSNPDCRIVTSGPHSIPNKFMNVGVAAHICAAAPGGKRYDPSMTPQQRADIENGIWLCPKCAKLIDSDESKYTPELLHAWKREHDTSISKELEGSKSNNGFLSNRPMFPEVDWAGYAARVKTLNAISYHVVQAVRIGDQLISLEEAIKDYPRLFLTGPAGCGKTTNLRQIFVGLLERIPGQIPIRIETDLYKPEQGLMELVRVGLLFYGLEVEGNELRRLLRTSEFVLLMDGWTEVHPDYRIYIRRDFERWLMEYPQHRCLVAARRYEMQGTFDLGEKDAIDMQIAELQPFSEEGLARYLEHSVGTKIDLGSIPPQLKEAACLPLYAQMLAISWKDKGRIDVSSVSELVDRVLARELNKTSGALSPSFGNELEEFVTELAAEMHRKLVIAIPQSEARSYVRRLWQQLHAAGRIVTPEEKVLQAIVENPLLVASETTVRFAHQLFQEFFAGRWVALRLEKSTEECKHYFSDIWCCNDPRPAESGDITGSRP